jgi:hypothetical protein
LKRAGPFLVLLTFVSSCALLRPPPEKRKQVEVTELSASFPGSDRGELKMTLDVEGRAPRPGEVVAVWWEVWLRGRWFASGTQALAHPLPRLGDSGPLALRLPVVFRRLTVVPGPTPLQIAVRGWLVSKRDGAEERMPFEAVRKIVSEGAPTVGAPRTETEEVSP